eukprot:COSAG05_NODE_694_length_7891_cov_5.305570_1_plen_109_part_00
MTVRINSKEQRVHLFTHWRHGFVHSFARQPPQPLSQRGHHFILLCQLCLLGHLLALLGYLLVHFMPLCTHLGEHIVYWREESWVNRNRHPCDTYSAFLLQANDAVTVQ